MVAEVNCRDLGGNLREKEIRKLVKEYALACNNLILARESNVMELWFKFLQLSFDEAKIVEDETKRLISAKELPEPVLSRWADDLHRMGISV